MLTGCALEEIALFFRWIFSSIVVFFQGPVLSLLVKYKGNLFTFLVDVTIFLICYGMIRLIFFGGGSDKKDKNEKGG